MSIDVGSKLEGKVTGITHFGAFVLLPSGVTGLVHISEIADTYVKDINDHLKVNDPVTVKVINVDKDGKIGLSIRQAQEQPASAAPVERERFGDRPASGSRPSYGDRPSGGSRPSYGDRPAGGSRPPYGDRPGGGSGGGGRPSKGPRQDRGGARPVVRATFEDKMSRFMKDSEERLAALKRNESKRGGRGGRRT